jgi:hypothetical protein
MRKRTHVRKTHLVSVDRHFADVNEFAAFAGALERFFREAVARGGHNEGFSVPQI